MRRQRSAKIVATLGPASSTSDMIDALFVAGVDVFRLNFSHGKQEEHRARLDAIRGVERRHGRPIGIMADLQGPKLRVGAFAHGKVTLAAGQRFRLDLDKTPGDGARAPLPHPEIFAAIERGTDLLLDDGNIRLTVEKCGKDFADTVVITGGDLSDRKGVNVPNAVLPLSALTPKDRSDLAFALELGVDWIALSFVQRPDDVAEAKKLDRRPRRRAGETREAGGDPPSRRDRRACGRADGRARRSWRRDAARGRAAGAAPDHPCLPRRRQAGGGGDADARIDGAQPGADPRRGLRRRHRRL